MKKADSASYKLRPKRIVVGSSPTAKGFVFAFDAAWEEFDTIDLAPYFWDGLKKLRDEIAILENPLRPYKEEDQKRLQFMVESLLQVRRMIDERGVY